MKEVKDPAAQQTRYEQMDADDRSMLKSAISRTIGSGKNAGMIPGESLEQFQKRIMAEVLEQLATKFEEVKENHAQQMVAAISGLTEQYELQLAEQMDKVKNDHSATIDTSLVQYEKQLKE